MLKNIFRRFYSFIHRPPKKASEQDVLNDWLDQFSKCGTLIHPSAEFTGNSPYGRIEIGTGCIIEREVTFWISSDDGADARLKIESKVFVGRNSYIGAYQPVTIGQNSMIGAYCYIISANHRYADRTKPIALQGFEGKAITLGEDVWLGTHVVVLPGVTIGRGAIVAACSLVNRDIPEYEIWGGVPAVFIKPRPY